MTNDYVMRQLEELARLVGKTLFAARQEKHPLFDEQGRFLDANFLYFRLKKLVLEHKINEAENLLFEEAGQGTRYEYLQTALDFYALLAALPDEQLQKGDFTREEIAQGLQEMMCLYGAA